MSQQTQENPSVVAKFRLNEKQGNQISLSAVTDEMNQSWANATPNGQLSMTIDNQRALDAFEQGKEYVLIFQDSQQWEQQHGISGPSGQGSKSSSS